MTVEGDREKQRTIMASVHNADVDDNGTQLVKNLLEDRLARPPFYGGVVRRNGRTDTRGGKEGRDVDRQGERDIRIYFLEV